MAAKPVDVVQAMLVQFFHGQLLDALVLALGVSLSVGGFFVLMCASFGVATLWMAVIADTGASLIVVANAMRLLRHA